MTFYGYFLSHKNRCVWIRGNTGEYNWNDKNAVYMIFSAETTTQIC